ncbi:MULTISPECIES: 4-aminobutyrate--2-oxoglutarate transaminase [unclassified Mesorhizobium]|jgi:4-aminobutyrate aminotransferase/(S)-3-amino-2-methylpropionate transaminase|uniref:4-aminobutyrate--2-oxoglutarate transaminase n=1 Tax=unclassified Mesorhizobium TaxID=325217 RepID=UPI0008DFC2C4|nr:MULTISPECIES: 4-aminobutyrate--2-oxoglutarate transaminase [unclassified Mesorhizobium]RJG43924.1 4-aminobutyrate--2-oxoglutarate transaminase [Mesorhizobium sp. DCY119]SFU07573.1 4-aminobutyrate aminotransferase apoenzyme [Mesorhizobium sp. YR577]
MTSNASLQSRRVAAIPRGVATAYPVFAKRAEGSEIWDVDDKRYVDFGGGIAVLNTGHRHPKVIAAVREQLDAFTHTAFQIVPYEPYIELCEKLNALAPFKGEAKSILFSTGAEAVENAVKIARAATGRTNVIAFTGAFHGRTLMTSALTGKVAPYKKKFGPMPGGIWHVPFPVAQLGTTVADTLKAIEYLFRADVDPVNVAAFIIEPVQGEGGFHPAPTELLEALRKLCDQHGILLIADEVQTGFARTGKMFGIENSGVEPDLLTIAKSLAGGFPLSGVIGRAEIMDAAEPGGLGGTYAGSPIACAAALAVLDVIAEEKLIDRANSLGDRIKGELARFAQRNDTVAMSAIRGPGAMVAFDIVKSRGSEEPDADATKRVTTAALAEGLVLLSCGVNANTIRILMPLTISDEILAEGLGKLEKALVAANA